MAHDRTSTEYHLTPHEWISGTNRFFGAVQGDELKPPVDCVETRLITITQPSGRPPKEYVQMEIIWKSPDVSDRDLAALYKKYPPPLK
jgi:hypothetical protein